MPITLYLCTSINLADFMSMWDMDFVVPLVEFLGVGGLTLVSLRFDYGIVSHLSIPPNNHYAEYS